ncbi:MAG: hypothetical protein MUO58_04540 [Anaerolineales bacterium]|nr:hypothetical protein [Anaerolineales bacterium]
MAQIRAIAAAFVGGVSAAGGVGKVVGSLIGAFVMTSLISGMNLMGMDIILPVHRQGHCACRSGDLRRGNPQQGVDTTVSPMRRGLQLDRLDELGA